MFAKSQSKFVYGLVLPAVFAVTSVAGAQEAPAEPSEEQCVAAVEAKALPVQAEPVELNMKLPATLGEKLSAIFAEESGVSVLEVVAAPAAEGEEIRNVLLRLNTGAAQAGEWMVTVANDEGVRCVATVEVKGAESR